jgi:hypothetical protein
MGWVVMVVLAALGLFFFIRYQKKAFPSASVDVKVQREQAEKIAADYLAARGFNVSGYTSVTIFSADEEAAIYLQKTLGMEKANEVMRDQVQVWFWQARWFRPLEKLEYRAAITPDGKVLRFRRELEEDKPGANLDQADARRRAEEFVANTAGIDLSQYEPVDASSEKQKNRTDHSFVWKKKGFQIGEAELRLSVAIQGDTVGGFRQFLKVPEQFEREVDKTKASGTLLAIVSFAFSAIIFIFALVIVMIRYKSGDLRWKFAVTLGSVIFVLLILAALNAMPLLKANYQTQVSYPVFLATILIVVAVASLVYGILTLLAGASGDSLTRELYPGSVASLNDLIAGRLGTPAVAQAAVRGYLLAFLLAGYFVIFYLIAGRFFHVFVQAEGPFSNILNTKFPFLFPLLVGFLASITEEFAYRFFGITVVKKYLKSTALALFIPAVIWALGHSTYPVFPVYVRGIEVTIVGLIFGYFFIRYDLLTCLVAHYAVDAIFVSAPLLKSSNRYFQISGVVVVALGLVPLLPALVRLVRRNET